MIAKKKYTYNNMKNETRVKTADNHFRNNKMIVLCWLNDERNER